jgi:hypothetical protein
MVIVALSFLAQLLPVLVVESFPDLVMLGTLVEPCQQLSRHRGHVRPLVIFARKLPHRLERVEPHNGDELHLSVVKGSAEELNPSVSWDLLVGDPREDLLLQQMLISLRVGSLRRV